MRTRNILIGVTTLLGIIGLGFISKEAYVRSTFKPLMTDYCLLNGLGEGTCDFTNTGENIGYMCGTVTLTNGSNNITSNTFCSGAVEPKDTITKSFSIVGLDKLCTWTMKDSWVDNCSMTTNFTIYEN